MNEFTIYPAIDLHIGQVVRLRQGSREKMITYEIDPEMAAREWINQGATWLHVVNLDGAFGSNSETNINALKEIISVSNGSASVQFGGGLRDLASIDHILSLGVSRVILGTVAIKNPDLLRYALRTFGPQKIILGVDAEDGFVKIAGWEEETPKSPHTLVNEFTNDGLETIIYTNIKRDGMGTGVDILGSKQIMTDTGLNVIASGGIDKIEDIKEVKSAGLNGVIVGKALYEKNFDLSEALSC
ncbi:MAG: 1-(5-phosphoribosyl)-5-[(5-phosphoribosylamino)methylideneamino]imidazole-4-carboxamide isomerase [Anaerolineales bacterium]